MPVSLVFAFYVRPRGADGFGDHKAHYDDTRRFININEAQEEDGIFYETEADTSFTCEENGTW